MGVSAHTSYALFSCYFFILPVPLGHCHVYRLYGNSVHNHWLAEAGIKELADYVPMAVVRFMDNLKLLFPDIRGLIVWPKLSFGIISKTPPFPNWTWQIVHTVSASFFFDSSGLLVLQKLRFRFPDSDEVVG